jgi:hypothetical protein
MAIERNWKYYLGLSLLIYSFIPYGVGALVLPFLPISHARAASIGAAIIASAEIAFFCGAALLGKPFVESVKAKIKGFLFRKRDVRPVGLISKGRHYFGVTLLLLSFLPFYVTEAVLIFGHPVDVGVKALIVTMLGGDALFMVSLFILGGEFWARLKRLFEWPGSEVRGEKQVQDINR